MAHGAPDHTTLSESGFAHYADRWVRRGGFPLVASPDWETALNVDIQGVFGFMYAWSNTGVFCTRITIDGTVVFYFTIDELCYYGFWGSNSSFDKMGCTRYNAVAPNPQYCMFYDEKWGLYIHNNITIECQRLGAFGTSAMWSIGYKELI